MSVDNRMTIRDISQVYDGPHATPEKIDEGPYFLSISSLEKGALDLSKSAHISETDFVKWTKRVTPEEGDLLFSYETRLGDAALMPAGIVGCLGRRMGLLRPNREKVIPEYLLYAYLSPEFQEIIRANTVHGATVDRIALKDMSSFSIRIPPLADQERVVSVLSSQDKKIQLNRQINQTLEAMAQAIFQSWFVDFDPVKAKIAAREQWQILTDDQRTEWLNELLNKQDYLKTCLLELTVKAGLNDDENLQLESSLDLISCRGYGPEGSENLDIGINNLRKEWQSKIAGPALQSASETLYLNIAAMTAISSRDETSLAGMSADEFAQLYKTASLFPERLVESELGEIPEGWEYSEIAREVKVLGGGTPSTKVNEYWEDGEYSWTTPKDLSNVREKILLKTERNITNQGLNKISSGLLPIDTVLMSSRAPVGYLALAKVPVAVNQGYIAMKCEDRLPPEYIVQWADSVMDEIKQRASGTTFAEISKKNFGVIPVLVPDEELIIEYKNNISKIYKRVECNMLETSFLSDIRDGLLPKLLSGELDVSSLTELSDIALAAMDV